MTYLLNTLYLCKNKIIQKCEVNNICFRADETTLQTLVSCIDFVSLSVESLSQQEQKLFSTPRLALHHLLNQVVSHLKAQPSKHFPTPRIPSMFSRRSIYFDQYYPITWLQHQLNYIQFVLWVFYH